MAKTKREVAERVRDKKETEHVNPALAFSLKALLKEPAADLILKYELENFVRAT